VTPPSFAFFRSWCRFLLRVWALAPLLALACASGARAEKADAQQPLQIEADGSRYDDARGTGRFEGHVLIRRGTLVLQADAVQVTRLKDGSARLVAEGAPARFRQKREALDEFVEAQAQRIEVDSAQDTATFHGSALLRRLQGSKVMDETAGAQIVWDSQREVFSVAGGSSGRSASNPGGRVRAVISPRDPAASAPR